MYVHAHTDAAATQKNSHASSNGKSQAVSHSSAVLAKGCLTSLLKWELANPTWHDCWPDKDHCVTAQHSKSSFNVKFQQGMAAGKNLTNEN